MAKKAASDAIRARLAANWTSSVILGLNSTTQTPADGSSWVRVTFPVANNSKMTLGRNYRESASALITVATQISDGLDTSNAWCESIAAIYRGQQFDGVDCAFDAPSIREGVDNGSYFIASVIVPYRFFYSD